MAKDSKKRKAERKANRQAWEQVAQVQQPTKLPQKVAIPEYLDGLNYQIIFEQYNNKECQLHNLDIISAKALVNKLKLITRYNSKSIAGGGLIRDNVKNSGSYTGLFDGLDAETEMKEIAFADTGRIFCYLVDDHPQTDGRVCNYCCIVAIKKSHI